MDWTRETKRVGGSNCNNYSPMRARSIRARRLKQAHAFTMRFLTRPGTPKTRCELTTLRGLLPEMMFGLRPMSWLVLTNAWIKQPDTWSNCLARSAVMTIFVRSNICDYSQSIHGQSMNRGAQKVVLEHADSSLRRIKGSSESRLKLIPVAHWVAGGLRARDHCRNWCWCLHESRRRLVPVAYWIANDTTKSCA